RGAGARRPEGGAEPGLGAWCARLDSLRAHGVVQLGRRRWLGAAARDSSARVAMVVLAPIREPLDSTLAPMLGGEVRIAPLADERVLADSLERDLGRLADVPDRSRRAASADSLELARARAIGGRLGVPEGVCRSGGRPRDKPIVVTAGGDTLRFASGEVGLTGQAVVRGLTHDGRQWKPDEFALTAQASFRSTMAGLYANVNEN